MAHSIPLRRVLFDPAAEYYYVDEGVWSPDAQIAKQFPSMGEIVNFCAHQTTPRPLLIISYKGDAAFDVRMPVFAG